MAELADALDLGSSDFIVGVQVPSSAPKSKNPNLVPIGEGFGFLLYLDYPYFNGKLKTNNIEISGDKTYSSISKTLSFSSYSLSNSQ